MSKMISASINVMKIDKTKLVKGEKGTYLNLTIWLRDEPDQYGHDVSIEQSVEKEDAKIYLGNGKVKWSSEMKPKEADEPTDLPF